MTGQIHPEHGMYACPICGFRWHEDEVLRFDEEVDGISEDDFLDGEGCPNCIVDYDDYYDPATEDDEDYLAALGDSYYYD